MNLKDINKDFITEDINYECKARLNDKDPLKWLKTVCAFANSNGGTIYCGVEDKTFKLIGYENYEIDKEKQYFYHNIKEHFQLHLNITSKIIPYLINDKTRYIIKFKIDESNTKPVILNYNGMPLIYIRRDGFTNIPTYEEIQSLALNTKNKHYDSQVLDIKYNENNFTSFFKFCYERKNAYPTLKELKSIPFFDDNLNLYAGSYLFSDNYSLENSKITCTYYPSKNKGSNEIIDSVNFKGNLIDGFYFIYNFVNKYQKHGFIKYNDKRVDTTSFPSRALFEAIINALVHRDYFIDDSQISVDLFTNRLVITSPGSFYGQSETNITYNLKEFASKRRNNLIASIFVYLKAMEAKGTGFEKIMEEYKDADALHKPYIFEKNLQFNIVLPDLLDKEGIPLNFDKIKILKPYEVKSTYDYQILSFCYGKYQSVKEIANNLNISNSSYFRNNILENLITENLLIRKIEGKTSFYLTNEENVKLR